MRILTATKAEKIAQAFCRVISDLHVDLDMVGYYVYRTMPPLMYNRFLEIAEAAKHEERMATDKEYAREFHKLGL